MKEKNNNILIVIPAYNEEESIGVFLDKLMATDIVKSADVLVVNDASTDRTVEIASGYDVTVISQIYNMGYGTALQLGYKYAVKYGYEYILQLDADGQHDVCNLQLLYDALQTGKYDIVIGSRFVAGAAEYKYGVLKSISVGFFKILMKQSTGQIINDPTSGLQGLNRKAFSCYATYGNFDYQYPDVNMIIQMMLKGYRIGEIPAVMHQREAGESMHSGIWKPIKYMIIMFISTIAAIGRAKKEYGRKK